MTKKKQGKKQTAIKLTKLPALSISSCTEEEEMYTVYPWNPLVPAQYTGTGHIYTWPSNGQTVNGNEGEKPFVTK